MRELQEKRESGGCMFEMVGKRGGTFILSTVRNEYPKTRRHDICLRRMREDSPLE